MNPGTAAHFFDAIAGRYERSYALNSEESRRRMRRVMSELPPPPARVLDLGVGTGRELTALLDAGYVPIGVDVSKQMLERCARRARPVELIHADFWAPLPFAPGSFDAVVALHGTLAHPPDEAALTRLSGELARLVRQAGTWLAETPSPAWLERVEALPRSTERTVRRTGPQTCVYEDHVAGASLEARVSSEAQWRDSLRGQWTTRIDALGEMEWLIVSTRT